MAVCDASPLFQSMTSAAQGPRHPCPAYQLGENISVRGVDVPAPRAERRIQTDAVPNKLSITIPESEKEAKQWPGFWHGGDRSTLSGPTGPGPFTLARISNMFLHLLGTPH